MQRQTKKLKIMATLSRKHATTKIFRLAKALSEINNTILGSTTTEIEMNLLDAHSGDIFYISKWDGQIMTIKPIFESSYLKVKVFIVEKNKYILDIK